MFGLGKSSCNSPAEGTCNDGVPVSTVAQSEHVIPSEVDNTVRKPIVPILGNGTDSVGKAGGSITGSGNDHTGKMPAPGINSHKSHVAGSSVPISKSIVIVPSA